MLIRKAFCLAAFAAIALSSPAAMAETTLRIAMTVPDGGYGRWNPLGARQAKLPGTDVG